MFDLGEFPMQASGLGGRFDTQNPDPPELPHMFRPSPTSP